MDLEDMVVVMVFWSEVVLSACQIWSVCLGSLLNVLIWIRKVQLGCRKLAVRFCPFCAVLLTCELNWSCFCADPDTGEKRRRRKHRAGAESDSDSELSAGDAGDADGGMDLASSHSSDDDDDEYRWSHAPKHKVLGT